MRYLSNITSDPLYEEESMKIFDLLYSKKPKYGLYKCYLNDEGDDSSGHIKLGALGDSFYEYLLKIYLQKKEKTETENKLLNMYINAINGIHKILLYRTKKEKLLYMIEMELSIHYDKNNENKEIENKKPIYKMDELVCFLPGLLILGSETIKDYKNKTRDVNTAKDLIHSCYEMFNHSTTGLSPEIISLNNNNNNRENDVEVYAKACDSKYLLRPETMESLYLMYYFTGDPIYKEWGWNIYLSVKMNCKSRFGYGIYKNVYKLNENISDSTESYFMSEFMKYLYLLINPKKVFNHSKEIFNTEGHIFPII